MITKQQIGLIEYVITGFVRNRTYVSICAIGNIAKINYDKIDAETRSTIESDVIEVMQNELNRIYDEDYAFLDYEFVELAMVDKKHVYVIKEDAIKNLSNKSLCAIANKYGINTYDYIFDGYNEQKFKFNYYIDNNTKHAELYEYDDANGWLLCATNEDVGYLLTSELHILNELIKDDFVTFIEKCIPYISIVFDYDTEYELIGEYERTDKSIFIENKLAEGWKVSLNREYFNDENANIISISASYNGENVESGLGLTIDGDTSIVLEGDWEEYEQGKKINIVTVDNNPEYTGSYIPYIKLNVLNADKKMFTEIFKELPNDVEKTNIPITILYDNMTKSYNTFIDIVHKKNS